MFYPDNVPRAGRLQQLVDSMANMQTDIEDYADKMDKRNKKIRPLLAKILKDQGIASIDVLIEQAMEQLTPEQQRQYENLIAAAKKANIFDWEAFVGGLLLLPAGKALNAKSVLGVGRLAVRTGALRSLAGFFKGAKEGDSNLVAAAEELIKNSDESSAEIKVEAEGTGEEPAVAEEVDEAASAAGKVAVGLRLLAAVGFVVTIIVGIVEIVEGAQQKEKLINAIHNCQPARLCIAYFQLEGENIIEQLELSESYLEALADTEDSAAVAAAKKLHDKLIENISTANSLIDWKTLERSLEREDKKSSSYYGGDDLDFNAVIRAAKAAEKNSQ